MRREYGRHAMFRFDPNQLDLEGWQKLGLSVRQGQSIINYRNKGGKFYKVEDLQKMYAIPAEKYRQLAPYVVLPAERDKFIDKRPYTKKELPIIEINSADTAMLDRIKGIGAAFARRIASYRARLGGFYKKEQLREVYGIDSVKYDEIKDQVSVDLSGIQKININTATFETLKSHPYLSYKQINAIINYRKQHGDYQNIDDLGKVAILTGQNIQNLAPYLIFK